jgi:hypothetical protein
MPHSIVHRRNGIRWRVNLDAVPFEFVTFGEPVRSKKPDAMINEVYCKIICHNICCLIHSIYELQIVPEILWASFKKEVGD